MVHIKYGNDKARIAAINLISDYRLGLKNEKIMHATTFDRAAKGVTKSLNQDEEACDMHDCDKIRKLVIGDLIRTRKRCSAFYNSYYLNLILTHVLKLCILLTRFQ